MYTRNELPLTSLPDPQVRELIAEAESRLSEAVRRQWDGQPAFKLSIPARPDHDTDLVIAKALHAADALLTRPVPQPEPLAVEVIERFDREAHRRSIEWSNMFNLNGEQAMRARDELKRAMVFGFVKAASHPDGEAR